MRFESFGRGLVAKKVEVLVVDLRRGLSCGVGTLPD